MRSRSILRWPVAPPDAARVVPRAEKKILGGMVVVGKRDGHWDGSGDMMGCRRAGEEDCCWGRGRRVYAWTEVVVEEERRRVRMLEPWVGVLDMGF